MPSLIASRKKGEAYSLSFVIGYRKTFYPFYQLDGSV